ncbi:MAG: NAD(P)-dependent oxidoreductase [Candidatus Sericytochromatia bacterium]
MEKKIAPKLSEEQYQKNFKDIKPPLNLDSAIAEANRCLYCYDAPCITACPTKIDIPSFIKKIATHNFKGSAKVILESNIMGGTCARVCPVETLCEGSCVYNGMDQKPIDIGRLQRFSTDWLMKNNDIKLFERKPDNGKKVAIIGAGPSGLSCAHNLSRMGYQTTVFEAKDLGGGLNTLGLAEYKITKEFALEEVNFVTEIGGIDIKYNTSVGKDVQIQDLLKDYDAVFVGVGLGTTPKLRVEGEDLEGVVDAIEFIEELKRGPFEKINVGQTVAVVGAGNTAIDAATQAKRLGAKKVYIVYRRTQKEMPAYEYEYGLALKDECEFLWQTNPTRIIGDDFVTGIELTRMELGEPDESGRRVPAPVKGSEFVVPVDMVIKALGQKPYESFLSSIEGLNLNWGKVVVNSDMQTSVPKLFAGGDCINGGKETVNAVQDGKLAAFGIHKMIFGEGEV